MGCTASTAHFIPNDNVPGQGTEAQVMFDFLGLETEELDLLYTKFLEIDVDGGGTVINMELYAYIRRDRTPFLDAVFAVFDDDKSGQIDFMEFVVCLWNLCTLRVHDIAGFAFTMCDVDESDNISMDELVCFLNLLYPKGSANTLIFQLQTDLNFKFTMNISEFISWCRENPAALSPVLKLHQVLCDKFGGVEFWHELEYRRSKHNETALRHPRSIVVIRQHMRALKKRYDDMRAVEAAEKELRVRIGLSQSNRMNSSNTSKLLGRFLGVDENGRKKSMPERTPMDNFYAQQKKKRSPIVLKPASEILAERQHVADLKSNVVLPVTPSKGGINPYYDKVQGFRPKRKLSKGAKLSPEKRFSQYAVVVHEDQDPRHPDFNPFFGAFTTSLDGSQRKESTKVSGGVVGAPATKVGPVSTKVRASDVVAEQRQVGSSTKKSAKAKGVAEVRSGPKSPGSAKGNNFLSPKGEDSGGERGAAVTVAAGTVNGKPATDADAPPPAPASPLKREKSARQRAVPAADIKVLDLAPREDVLRAMMTRQSSMVGNALGPGLSTDWMQR